MNSYVVAMQTFFEVHADPLEAAGMKQYMRGQFEYLGIKTPTRLLLAKEFYAQYGLPTLRELDGILRELWALPEREYQYIAIGLLGKFAKELPARFIKTMEYLITTKSWWDTVDTLAGGAVGTHFKLHPEVREQYLVKWRQSKNMWLRRTAILFQLNYKETTDFKLLCEIIQENLGSKEFFINKAIGWALRQYARVDPKSVKKFVKSTPDLSPLSQREALKHL